MRPLFLSLALIRVCIAVNTSRSAFAFEFAQAAVVDPEKPLAYLMAPEAKIDEVDLSSGQIDLSVNFETDVPLPSRVHPLIDDHLGSSFTSAPALKAARLSCNGDPRSAA